MDAAATTQALQLAATGGGGDIVTAVLLMLRRLEWQTDAGNLAAAGRLARVGWPELRQLLARAFRRLGYVVEEVEGSAASVVDLILEDDRGYTYVQCSMWAEPEVRAVDVRRLRDAMEMVEIPGGIWVSAGRVTEPAEHLAGRAGITLLDAVELEHLLSWAEDDNPPPAPKTRKPRGGGGG